MKKNIYPFLLFFAFVLAMPNCYSQDYQVRIGFIGNSITIGSGLANPTRDCYPSQFAQLLKGTFGDTCIVDNFAVSGRTMLKKGDYPIWNESSFPRGWRFAPDILFILLGTNDTKPYNWDVHGDEFIGDYLSMIDTFKVRNPNTKFIICYPPPAFAVAYDIRNTVIVNSIIPAVDSVLKKRDAYLLDFYNPLLNFESLFPDKIHPNPEGAAKMAKMVYDKFIETDIIHQVKRGYTFITDIKSNTASLASKDSATLSWTIINADSVFIDGVKVDVKGGVKIAPEQTTTYMIKAFGPLNVDSLTFTQNVYLPKLTKMNITPTNLRVNQGDSTVMKLTYFDQFNKIVQNQLFKMNWTIEKGLGKIVNQTDTSAVFIAGSSTGGKVYIKAESDGVSIQAAFIINASTGAQLSSIDDQVKVFPNPSERQVSFSFVSSKSESVRIILYNTNGQKIKEKVFKGLKEGKQTLTVDTKSLTAGTYIYKITGLEKDITGKFTRQMAK